MTSFEHTTVMLRETVSLVGPVAGHVYADATVGGGGHAEAILEASGPDGRLIGVDRDPVALRAAETRLARFGERATLVHARFSELPSVLARQGAGRVHGIVADLGVSSPQLDDAARGFSFTRSGPLDMRMNPDAAEESALDVVSRLDESALADVIYQYGGERRSRRIARSIVRARENDELSTTTDLRRAVVRAVGPQRSGGVDPATRTFMALRIAVNEELDELEALLRDLPELLADGGVSAIISFHSLEDRLVKRAFRSDARLEPLSKRPLVPSEEECAANPRARSAKLRAARRRARSSEVSS